ncbi:MAG: hypothetical protein ACTSX9_08280 [Candidatus Njordarchaeales archaeon]
MGGEEYFLELLSRDKLGEAKEYILSLLNNDDPKGLLEVLESAKKSRKNLRKLCALLPEIAINMELWNSALPFLMNFLKENCGEGYLVDFRIVLRNSLAIRGRVCDLKIYELVSGEILKLLELVLNKEVREELGIGLDDILRDIAKSKEIWKRLEMFKQRIMNRARELLEFSGVDEKLVEVVEGLRILLLTTDKLFTKEFSQSFIESLERIGNNFDKISAFASFYILCWLNDVPRDKLESLFLTIFRNPELSIVAISAIVLSLHEILVSEKGGIAPGNAVQSLISLLGMNSYEVIELYGLLKNADLKKAAIKISAKATKALIDKVDVENIGEQLYHLKSFSIGLYDILDTLTIIIQRGRISEKIIIMLADILEEQDSLSGAIYAKTLEAIWNLAIYGRVSDLRRIFGKDEILKRFLRMLVSTKDNNILLALSSVLKNISHPTMFAKIYSDKEFTEIFNNALENLSRVIGSEEVERLKRMIARVE